LIVGFLNLTVRLEPAVQLVVLVIVVEVVIVLEVFELRPEQVLVEQL